jgi:site-specific DNA recombinase
MPSTNGSSRAGQKRAILYARVSSAEQVEGYSLDQQIDALRAWVSQEGYEVLAEVRDEGWSAAYLERPGLDQVRDLVEAGGVSVVAAQDADRITREPAHRAFLDGECERFGARLVALDDWGDDTHEGELLRFLKGWMAKGERIKTVERSRRGRVQKARQGEIVGAHPPRFGFRFVRNDKGKAVGYEVDEEKMAVVRRIFRMVGEEGMTLYAVRKDLAAAGILSPSGKKLWHQGYLRTMILDDIYRPHTFEEVRDLVSPAVAATLDPDSSYGICYYDRRRQTKTVAGKTNGRYRYSYASTYRPKESWLAVPVPDSGIPRGWVDRAREVIKDNRRPSSAGLRFWELSAGVLRCASCGRAMQTTTITSSTGKVHHYYRCPLRVRDGKDGCDNPQNLRADYVEPLVWKKVSGLLKDPERLRVGLAALIEEKKRRLRSDPEREALTWLRQLDELAGKRAAYQDQQAAGLMTLDELGTRLAELEDVRRSAESELAKLRTTQEEIESLEADADTLLASYERATPEKLDALEAEERHRVYKLMRLEVLAHLDGSLEAQGDVPLDVSKFSITNTSSALSTSARSTRIQGASPKLSSMS